MHRVTIGDRGVATDTAPKAEELLAELLGAEACSRLGPRTLAARWLLPGFLDNNSFFSETVKADIFTVFIRSN